MRCERDLHFCQTYGYEGVGVTFPPDDTVQGQLRRKVEGWLLENGWSLTPGANPEVAWLFIATDESGRKIVIHQKMARHDQVVIESSVDVADEHVTRMNALPAQDRDRLMTDLKMELIRLDVDYVGLDLPLKRFGVTVASYLDGLSKDLFMERVNRIRRAVILAILLVNSRL